MNQHSRVSINQHTGSRFVQGNLIVINQTLAEAWVIGGDAWIVWSALSTSTTVLSLANTLASQTGRAFDASLLYVKGLLQALWLRRIVLLDGNLATPDTVARAALPEAHNKSGYLLTVAVATEAVNRCTFDLLVPCNLRCKHCYLDFSQKDIMPLSTAAKYFTQLAALGCVDISLTGGEIFLRKDLLDVLDACLEQGFLVDLLTNGMFIDDNAADALQQRAISEVQISVYGTTAESHEATTRHPGSFSKSIAAVRRLVDRGIRVRLAMVVQKDNYQEAFRFSDFASALGARAQFDTKLVPTRDGNMTPLEFGVSVQQLSELYRAGIIKKELGYECSAAVSKMRITADGEVYPCEIINNVSMGNLNQVDLSTIWSSAARKQLRADIIGFTPHRCGGCHQSSECEPCAAMRGFGYEKAEHAEVSEACVMTTAGVLADASRSPAYKSSSMHHLTDVYEGFRERGARTPFTANLVQIMGVRL